MSVVAPPETLGFVRRRHWRIPAGLTTAFIVTAALAWAALSSTWPETPVHVHVRWRADVTDPQRVELERRFHLNRGVRGDGRSWEYQLADPSTTNVRQLIQDAQVEDTAHLNRIRFRPEFAQDRSRQILAYSLAAGAGGLALGAMGTVMFLLIGARTRRRSAFGVRLPVALLPSISTFAERTRRVAVGVRAHLPAGALVAAIVAVSLPLAAREAAGPRGALVNVRWEASVDAAARARLEARLRLVDGVSIGGSTWRYDLVDPSRDALRAVVNDPAVDDTYRIDREDFTLDDAVRTSRRGRIASGDLLVATADALALAVVAYIAWPGVIALRRFSAARDMWTGPLALLARAETHVWPSALLVLLGLAAYAGAIWFPLTNGDDLIYLNSVARVANPLSYFTTDSGLDNNMYRPLTSVSVWMTYRAFGVWGPPHQIINLLLHIVNVILLYRIIERVGRDKTIAVLVAALFMVSKYTWLAATYISDRPMVLTGTFLLLLIHHLSQRDSAGETAGAGVRVSTVAALSVLALMSKESGIVVPAVGFLYSLMPARTEDRSGRRRVRLALVTVSIIGLYLAFRVVIFGPNFAAYGQDGYMFLGALHYQDSQDLPTLLRYVNFAENVVKNALTPVLPVFAEGGALLTRQTFFALLPVIASTVLLFGFSLRRDLTRLQWIAVMVMLVNAVAHYALFRFRLQYMAHAAFCLFVAGSPILAAGPGARNLKPAIRALAVIALGGSLVWTSYMVDEYRQQRDRALEMLRIDGVQRFGPVVEEVLEQYR